MRKKIKKALAAFNLKISRLNPKWHNYAFLQHYGINTIIDIGANTGQFALEILQDTKFKGMIYSFEPQSIAFNILNNNSLRYPNWKTYHLAVGEENGFLDINIASGHQSSSFFEIEDRDIFSAHNLRYIDKETVEVSTMQKAWRNMQITDNVFVKIDVQGFENKVLRGMTDTLGKIKLLQIETSFKKIYKDSDYFFHTCEFLYSKGFRTINMDPAFIDIRSGEVIEADFYFINDNPGGKE